MANDAMAHLPPLTFFQGQIIDDHGTQHEYLDLFQTTLHPLIDMARVFSLEQGAIGGAPTDLRLEQYAEAQPAEETLFKESAEAFRIALTLQARLAAANNDAGLCVNPDKLDKFEQQLLKSIFRNILALLKKCASHFDLVPRR
jgi:CBS domain-containing protein